jgi:ketosteroid isomerase-like protein
MADLDLQAIVDRIEIDDLLTRYATAVDEKDWDLYATCFTPDAYIDYTQAGGIKGKFAEVRDWLARTMPMFPMSQHVVANRVIQVNGDEATARSIFYNPMALPDGDSQKVWIEGGYYNDKLIRTPDGWRITERIEDSSYSTMRHKLFQPQSG